MGILAYLRYSQPLGDRNDVLGREPEMLEQILGDAGGAERMHGDDRAARSNVAVPRVGRGRFDRDPAFDLLRQHAFAIALVLCIEQARARHRNYTHAATLLL